ncbi:2-oxo acid dehydrogenase subunit E2 [Micromonospora sp. 4G57]|uniref:Dihydrolipoamide acetyltransferase component of pyruvate dehydrogenase complex n=1 Tax=Micromonospora sicca TaxID=2202420 RepID=A0ABU5J6N9_9ACTN|nr:MULTISPECIES: 2-oxo acid dehydrogenase subunit E2 [unclassified Micromonospora]MDZ5443036.1 2-oxo acid dehydrogenase subunit E2 [Micromonospora sp. 4G57]MDZ5488252.1 2-oxo acid dehydrogenase subunit E2 [Micromonospora sp. 4G53]
MTDLVVPKLNNNDTSYVLTDWLAEDGEQVKSGDPIAEVETSKAAEELLSDATGVLHRLTAVSQECAPGDVIGYVFDSEEARQRFLAEAVAAAAAPAEDGNSGGPVLTDSARELAAAHGIGGTELRGLGKAVVRRTDVERLLADRTAAPAAAEPVVVAGAAALAAGDGPEADDPRSVHQLTRAQRAVAAVVTESHREVPAALAVVKVRADAALAVARQLTRATRTLIGLPELLVKAIGGLREDHPLLFASPGDGGSVRLAEAAHVGVTIDVGTGLFIPVVRDVEELTCAEIAETLMDFRTRAGGEGFRAGELAGGTIVVSLHTDPDVVLAGPIVFPGQTCVVAIGGTQDELALDAAGQVVVRRFVNLSAVYDHRVVNGREAVAFLQAVKAALEAPDRLAEE